MRIWIDADGCPVVAETIAVAKAASVPVTVVKNYAVKIESDYAKIITVDVASDAADYYIANRLESGDLVITQDNGLAAMVLAKRGLCLNQNGKEITSLNIDFILDSRHHGRVARAQNMRSPKHKKRSKDDDLNYIEALNQFLKRMEGSHHVY